MTLVLKASSWEMGEKLFIMGGIVDGRDRNGDECFSVSRRLAIRPGINATVLSSKRFPVGGPDKDILSSLSTFASQGYNSVAASAPAGTEATEAAEGTGGDAILRGWILFFGRLHNKTSAGGHF